MSAPEDLTQRVYEIEGDVRVLKNDVSTMKGELTEIGRGVQQLIRNEARRPEPMNGKTLFATVAATAVGLGAVWTVVTFVIASSDPIKKLGDAVTAITHRLDRIDHPEDGKIARMNERVGSIEAWRATVTPVPALVTKKGGGS